MKRVETTQQGPGMTPPLQGKTVVIIGGTSGIGHAATRACLEAGGHVLSVGLGEPAHPFAASEMLRVRVADACDPRTASDAIDAALETFGAFDALYHVAGGSGRKFGDGPLHEVTDAAISYTLTLNLHTVIHSNRAAVRSFIERGVPGVVLNLGSVLATSPSPKHFTTHLYAAAKSAIVGFTQSCAACYAPRNIRFNVLAPGLTDTPMARRAAQDAAILEFIKRKQPLDGGRLGLPEDLSAAAVFLLSPQSAFITGQVLAVDGGWTVCDGA